MFDAPEGCQGAGAVDQGEAGADSLGESTTTPILCQMLAFPFHAHRAGEQSNPDIIWKAVSVLSP